MQATVSAVPGVDSASAAPRRRSKQVLPGFGLTLGYTLLYLSIIVLIPLVALLTKTFSLTSTPR